MAQVLTYVTHAIEAHKDLLCELDGEVGDGDHGVSMTIGMRAARQALLQLTAPTPERCFAAVSDAFADEVGASSGVIYEAVFAAAARAVRGLHAIERAEHWDSIFTAIAAAVQETGRAELGDKTMLDAWMPAAQALHQARVSGQDLEACLSAAVEAAGQEVIRTAQLIPRRGRASLLGERARGHRDAGATSAYLIIRALRDGANAPGGPSLPPERPPMFPDKTTLDERLAPWQPSVLTWQAFAPFLALGGTLPRALEEIASFGFFSAVELPAVRHETERKKIRRLVHSQGWQAMVWASDVQAAEQLNLAATDDDVRKRSRDRLRLLVREAAECGANRFGFCSPPDCGSADWIRALEILTAELITLGGEAEKQGVSLAFEGLDRHAHKKGLLGTASELDQMARRVRATVPSFGLVWDAAHAALNGEDLVASYRTIAPHAVIAHFSDAVLDRGSPNFGDRHLPIGSGSALSAGNIRAVVQAMRQEHRRDGAPLFVAVEEYSTQYGWRTRDVLQRAWTYVEGSLV